ncbi:hypothetical protein EDB83DRAFT_2222993, partial [Lactarius deliciosus]
VNAPENDYYAMYHTINNSLFPPDSDYTVASRSYSILNSHKSVDLAIGFVVLLEDKPVLFLEIEEPRRITLTSTRKKADNQMRIRMRARLSSGNPQRGERLRHAAFFLPL